MINLYTIKDIYKQYQNLKKTPTIKEGVQNTNAIEDTKGDFDGTKYKETK